MRACNGICFLFHFLILFARMCSTFNIIPLNCLPRSSATRISNLCVCNKQHTAYYTILYTHKSTFHTPHSRFSFFLSIYLSAVVVLFSSTFRWKFVSNTTQMNFNGEFTNNIWCFHCYCCCWTSWEREKEINFINIITSTQTSTHTHHTHTLKHYHQWII